MTILKNVPTEVIASKTEHYCSLFRLKMIDNDSVYWFFKNI